MFTIITIIGLSILILAHEFGHFLMAKIFGVKVEEFGIGFPPRLLAKKIGETVYSINLLPFGGFVKIWGEDGDVSSSKNVSTTLQIKAESSGDERSFGVKPIWQRSAMILGGILMNILLGWLVLSVIFMIGVPEHLAIVEVIPDSPAAQANIKPGSILLEVRYGNTILQDPIKSEEFVNLVKEAGDNPIFLKIKEGKNVLELSLRGRINPPQGQGALGIALMNVGFPAQSFFQSFIKGAVTTWATLKAIIVAFGNFFAGIFVNQQVFETVTGPIGIFSLASQAGSFGFVYFLQFMALISLNLAILNLIPFPALDGGRFLFLLIEKIKGSPVSARLQIAVNSIGFVFLIILMALITVRDISRLFN